MNAALFKVVIVLTLIAVTYEVRSEGSGPQYNFNFYNPPGQSAPVPTITNTTVPAVVPSAATPEQKAVIQAPSPEEEKHHSFGLYLGYSETVIKDFELFGLVKNPQKQSLKLAHAGVELRPWKFLSIIPQASFFAVRRDLSSPDTEIENRPMNYAGFRIDALINLPVVSLVTLHAGAGYHTYKIKTLDQDALKRGHYQSKNEPYQGLDLILGLGLGTNNYAFRVEARKGSTDFADELMKTTSYGANVTFRF